VQFKTFFLIWPCTLPFTHSSQKVIFHSQICFHLETCSSLRSPPEASGSHGQPLLPVFCLTWCVSAKLKTSLETIFPWQCLEIPPQLFFPTFIRSPPMKSTSMLSMKKETVSLWLVKKPLLKVRNSLRFDTTQLNIEKIKFEFIIFPTLSEQGTVQNLRVTEETTNSFRVSWRAAPGSVIRYHLSYVPLSGTGEILEAQTIGAETTIVLQELFPITTYRVSVSAEYASGIGGEMRVDGTTKEGKSRNYLSLGNFVKILFDEY